MYAKEGGAKERLQTPVAMVSTVRWQEEFRWPAQGFVASTVVCASNQQVARRLPKP